MGEFTRKDLIELGGGWVVSHSPEALYDLQCYYEAIELYLTLVTRRAPQTSPVVTGEIGFSNEGAPSLSRKYSSLAGLLSE
jgi:hypothetical protein